MDNNQLNYESILPKRKNNVVFSVIVVILVIAVAAVCIFVYGKNIGLNDNENKNDNEIVENNNANEKDDTLISESRVNELEEAIKGLDFSYLEYEGTGETVDLGVLLWKYSFATGWCKLFEYDDNQYIINYEDVRSNYTNDYRFVLFGTEYDFNMNGVIEEIDGEYYDHSVCSRVGNLLYQGSKLEVKSESNNQIIYTVVSTYAADFDSKEMTTEEDDFIIEKEDGEWKVKYFVLPN